MQWVHVDGPAHDALVLIAYAHQTPIKAHVDAYAPSSARGLNFGLIFFVCEQRRFRRVCAYASNEGYGESAHMRATKVMASLRICEQRRLWRVCSHAQTRRTFVARRCDKYQNLLSTFC